LERRALAGNATEAGLSRSVSVDESIDGAWAAGWWGGGGVGGKPMDPACANGGSMWAVDSEVSVFLLWAGCGVAVVPVAGDEMTLAVYHHLRAVHQLMVGS